MAPRSRARYFPHPSALYALSSPSPGTPPAEAEVVGLDPEPLVALAYVSAPAVPFSDRDLVDLLFAARRWNAHYGITGRLVALEADGQVSRFYQWIEGPEAALASCFARIEADARHRDIEVRFRGPVDARRFPGWDMGIQKADASTFDAEMASAPGPEE